MSLEAELRALLLRLVREDPEVRREVAEAVRAAAVHPDAALLTCRRAAEVVSVSPGTLRRWIREGRLPVTGSGRGIRIRRADLDKALIRGRRVEGDAAELGREFGRDLLARRKGRR